MGNKVRCEVLQFVDAYSVFVRNTAVSRVYLEVSGLTIPDGHEIDVEGEQVSVAAEGARC